MPASRSASDLLVRPVQWPDDREAVQQLDTSFTIDQIYEVNAIADGFTLVRRPISPPRVKSYPFTPDEVANSDVCLMAEDEGRVVGIAGLSHERWNRRAIVTHLYVDWKARRRGVGSRLIRELDLRARTLGARCLWVETQNVNTPAIQFYRSAGFTLCGLDITLYEPSDLPGEVGLFLSLPLLSME